MPDDDPRKDGPPREGRPRPSRREILRLIRAAYAVTLPYVLVFVLVLALVAWILTTLVF